MRYFKHPTEGYYIRQTPLTEDCTEVSRDEVVDYSEGLREAIRNSPSKRIMELKAKLSATDFKVLPDYDKPLPEGLLADRLAWREEIRSLEETL